MQAIISHITMRAPCKVTVRDLHRIGSPEEPGPIQSLLNGPSSGRNQPAKEPRPSRHPGGLKRLLTHLAYNRLFPPRLREEVAAERSCGGYPPAGVTRTRRWGPAVLPSPPVVPNLQRHEDDGQNNDHAGGRPAVLVSPVPSQGLATLPIVFRTRGGGVASGVPSRICVACSTTACRGRSCLPRGRRAPRR